MNSSKIIFIKKINKNKYFDNFFIFYKNNIKKHFKIIYCKRERQLNGNRIIATENGSENIKGKDT